MNTLLGKLQWWMANSTNGDGYLISKSDVRMLLAELDRLKEEIAHSKQIPWGQEVPVLTFEQIRQQAREAKEKKLAGVSDEKCLS